MKIKICGLFREEDIDYVNEARPDYCGFVFTLSRRQVSAELASRLRRRLAEGIAAVGVFIDAHVGDVAALYRDGVINIAQLHGDESEEYIARLKEASGDTPVPVIKAIKSNSIILTTEEHGGRRKEEEFYHEPHEQEKKTTEYCCPSDSLELHRGFINSNADYYLFDSGAGSGKPFNWEILNPPQSPRQLVGGPSPYSLFKKPWFLAGGICMDNIELAMTLEPFGIDVSSGAETDGVKDREKILRLTKIVREGNKG